MELYHFRCGGGYARDILQVGLEAVRRGAKGMGSRIASAVYFLVNAGNLVGETWANSYLFGSLELGLAAFIFVVSLRWPWRGA